ncbi:MAG: T9SS type A sorting domain-containing protein [Sediminibacterium sp.]|nr:T9SS type A sorting domain-containing protein [Sediminibacterium sp.]
MNYYFIHLALCILLIHSKIISQTYPASNAQGLKFWLKNESGITLTGGAVSSWSDLSGSGVSGNMIQATAAKRPIVVTGINYNEYVRFDGIDDLLNSTNTFSATSMFNATNNTIFFLKNLKSGIVDFKWETASSGSYRLGSEIQGGGTYRFDFADDGSGSLNSSTTNILNQPLIYGLTTNGTSSITTLYYNSILNTTKNTGFSNLSGAGTTATNLYLGGNNPSVWPMFTSMDIGEFMVINRLLTATELRMVESYLALKYGITLGSGTSPQNYTASNNTTIWTGTAAYQNRIIGIGRDNAASGSSLFQKQSKTPDDTVRLYMGALAALNRNNASAISNNLSFVVVGSNSGKMCRAVATNTEIPLTCGITSRLDREWRIQNTNFTNSFNMDFKLNACAATNSVNTSHLLLLVDNDGNFANGGTTCYASGLGGLTITYANPVITVTGISTVHIPANATRFITIASTNPLTPLPLDLVELNSNCNGNNIQINWATASENSSLAFQVEKSSDAALWHTIGYVKASGNSYTQKQYSFKDTETPATLPLYYRLKTEDINHSFDYSAVTILTSCSRNPANNYTLVYNTIHNYISISKQSGTVEADVVLINQLGQVLKNVHLTNADCMITTDELPAGIYYVTILEDNTRIKTEKIIKPY